MRSMENGEKTAGFERITQIVVRCKSSLHVWLNYMQPRRLSLRIKYCSPAPIFSETGLASLDLVGIPSRRPFITYKSQGTHKYKGVPPTFLKLGLDLCWYLVLQVKNEKLCMPQDMPWNAQQDWATVRIDLTTSVRVDRETFRATMFIIAPNRGNAYNNSAHTWRCNIVVSSEQGPRAHTDSWFLLPIRFIRLYILYNLRDFAAIFEVPASMLREFAAESKYQSYSARLS